MTSVTHDRHHAAAPPPVHHRVLHPWRPLLVRLHFYAGVFVAPFIVIVSLTGLIYTFTPQLERAVYAEQLAVDPQGRAALPLHDQLVAATTAYPNLPLATVNPGAPDETTRFDFTDSAISERMSYRSVYVDPYSGDVRGDLVTNHGRTPMTSWLGALHGDLHLGEPGRLYAELAASWLFFVMFGGVFLWWERAHRHTTSSRVVWKRFFVVDRSHPGMRRTMSWHSTAGVWALIITVLLALSGLFFAPHAGVRWDSLVSAFSAETPRMSPALPGAATGAVPSGGHAGHHVAPLAAAAPTDVPGQVPTGSSSFPLGFSADDVVAAAREAGIEGTPRLSPPTRPGTGWVVAETDTTLPGYHRDQVLIDPMTLDVVRSLHFADYPFLAKVFSIAMGFHFGSLLGFAGQILFALTMIGLIAVSLWGYQMWWQRRPHHPGFRLGRVPKRGAWRGAPRAAFYGYAALTILAMWVLPVFGVSLAAFLLIDGVIGWRTGRHSPAPEELDRDLPASV